MATRPLRGLVFHRSEYFVHRASWSEFRAIPFVSPQILIQSIGETPVIDELMYHLRDPTTIPNSTEVRMRAHSVKAPYFLREDVPVEFARVRLKQFPLETTEQTQNPIEAIVARILPHADDPPGRYGYYLIHYLKGLPWVEVGNQPLGYEGVFNDKDEEVYDYGSRTDITRPEKKIPNLWDIVEFNPENDRRWILGLMVGVESVGPFVSFPAPKRDKAKSEIDNEIARMVEPSRQKHEGKTPESLPDVRKFAGELYEYAGHHQINGISTECVWVNYGDGTRHLAQMPSVRTRIPLTTQEKIWVQWNFANSSDIMINRKDPTYMVKKEHDILLKENRIVGETQFEREQRIRRESKVREQNHREAETEFEEQQEREQDEQIAEIERREAMTQEERDAEDAAALAAYQAFLEKEKIQP